jgi:hypothetical protein
LIHYFIEYIIARNNNYIPYDAKTLRGIYISSDKAGAINSVKFVLAVLKQHTKELERLVTELDITKKRLNKIEDLMNKINLVLDDISDLKERIKADVLISK